MQTFDNKDPYRILAISPLASEAQISKAFQDKLRTVGEKGDREKLIHAYGLISNQAARDRFKWDEMSSILYQLPESDALPPIDLEALVRELAFLTPWELGDDACMN